MKKGFWTAFVLLAASQGYAAAQQPGDLNRQMEVTRAYEPTVEQAAKLNIRPDLTDTMTLRPEASYRITPLPINRGFQIQPIRAARINTMLYPSLTPFYLKAGVGIPFQSVFDFYYSSTPLTKGKFGVYANHYGQWSKIENDLRIKTPATETYNDIGVFGERRFGRLVLEGEIGYDFDAVSRYGYYSYTPGPALIDTTGSALRQDFSNIRGHIAIGNPFEDLSYFNVRATVGLDYFSDRFDYAETTFRGGLEFGKGFGGANQDVRLELRYEGVSGSKSLSEYRDNIYTLRALYHLQHEFITLGLGFSLDHAVTDFGQGSEQMTRFNPLLDLKADLSRYFSPYLLIDGKIGNNGYRNTVELNPYVLQGLVMPNTAETNGRIGVTGDIGSAFSYKIFGGVTYYKNLNLFANLFAPPLSQGNLFDFVTSDAHFWTAGAEIEGHPGGSFEIEAGIRYYNYTMDKFSKAVNFPDLTGKLALKYKPGEKFALRAGAELTGRRHFLEGPQPGETGNRINTIDPVVNLTLGMEYGVSKRLGIFIGGDNLLNQKLYPFNRYRALGINVIGGIKLQF